MGNIGSTEFVVVVLVLVILFGSQKISNLARGVGEATKEIKKVQGEYEKALKGEVKEEDKSVQEEKKGKEKEEEKEASAE